MFWDISPLLADPSAQPCYHYLASCSTHRRFVHQLRYDPLNKLLFSVASDGLVCAWNPEAIDPANPHAKKRATERELAVFALPHGTVALQNRGDPAPRDLPVLFCDVSWDGRFIATGAADGVVRHAGWVPSYGQAILVDHGLGYSTLYAHTTQIRVKSGDVVKRGERIATMGSSGRSTGTHLHYEVWKDGQAVNPRDYFK